MLFMPTYANKSKENKSRAAANNVSPGQKGSGNSFRFIDNRPEAIAQRKLQEIANSRSQTVIQREVFKARGGDNVGKWYTTYDPDTYFDSRDDALAHQKTFTDAILVRTREEQEAKKTARLEKRKMELSEKFSEYEPPISKTARLFKDQDKAFDDVPVTTLDPSNAKQFMEHALAERKAGLFHTQVVNLGGYYHVIAPGTDIGLTPAMNRPDLAGEHGNIPLSREGQPKKYDALARGLDLIAVKYVGILSQPLIAIRERMGKDIMRITRASQPKGTIAYDREELALLNEIAAVLRLDKGRVPKATKYIMDTITVGTESFADLFVKNKYVGAGSGGVEKLRGQQIEEGELSEGSDIEEEPKTPVSVSTSGFLGMSSGIQELNTWQDARMGTFNIGDRIRIMNHVPNISDRIFRFKTNWDPSMAMSVEIGSVVERIDS